MSHLVQMRDQALAKISQGISHFNQNKTSVVEMQKGKDLTYNGVTELYNYIKQESNQQIVNTLKAKLNEFLNSVEAMKKEIDAINAQQQSQQQQSQNNNNQQNNNNNQNNDKQAQSGIKEGDGQNEDDKKYSDALSQAIVTEKPNVKWEDVAGLEQAKAKLKEAVIMPIKFPQLFDNVRQPWKGILLYGPPGTGKTFLAKACATECDATFFSISSADLISKYVGESEKLIKALFKMARDKKPSIIFIDEVDSMTGNREGGGGNEASQRVKTQFLIEMQGVGHDDRGLLVLGATNIPWGLDPAIRRRFEKRILINLPENGARYELIKNTLKKTDHSLNQEDMLTIANELTEGFSGADLSILVRDAVYQPLRKAERAQYFKPINNTQWTPCSPSDPDPRKEKKNLYDLNGDQLFLPKVSMDDFMEVLGKIKPSVSKDDIMQHVKWTNEFGEEG